MAALHNAISMTTILTTLILLSPAPGHADIVQNDDVIVEGSLCASDGDSCSDGESFGAFGPAGTVAELLVKDNFPAIVFLDTDLNEANWIIETDAGGDEEFAITNDESDTTPFIIENGAPTNALVIDTTGRLGIGTATPASGADLHIVNDSPQIRFEDNAGTTATWRLIADNVGFDVCHIGGCPLKLETDAPVNSILIDGDGVSITSGFVALSSSRAVKQDIRAADRAQILESLANLSITSWTYRDKQEDGRHIGPMAEDFHAAFGLGSDETGISVVDLTGIALASIQALHSKATWQDQQNKTQETTLARLERLSAEKDWKIQELQRDLANREADFLELRAEMMVLRETVAALTDRDSPVPQ